MLTFTEFFTKKKIDLDALRQERPELYQEFDRDYALMGEKSFDHSKKFWFNRLRKDFLLEEISVEIPPAEKKAETVPVATPPVEGASKPAGFRPKFKAAAVPKPTEDQPDVKETEPAKPAGFTPKFRPKTAQSTPEIPERPGDLTTEEKKPAAPSGFKPRFKAAAPPKQVEEGIEGGVDKNPTDTPKTTSSDAEAAPSSKPAGFKPRFKAATPPKKVDSADNKEDAQPNKEETPVSTAKPKGFTPRFKASAPPVKVDDTADRKAEDNQDTPDTEPNPSKPKGFTPRFKAAQVPKQEDDQKEIKSPDETSAASDAAKPVKLGFKPKIKSQIQTKDESTESPASALKPEVSTEGDAGEPTNQAAEIKKEKKPTGFKPRFVVKNKGTQNDGQDENKSEKS